MSSPKRIVFTSLLLMAAWCALAAAKKDKHTAENALCQANLREIGGAIHAYNADHNGRFPNTVNTNAHPWRWWDQSLYSYVQDLTIFYCPGHTPERFPLLGRDAVLTTKRGAKLKGIPLHIRGEKLLFIPYKEPENIQKIPLVELAESEVSKLKETSYGERSPLLPPEWDRRDLAYGMNFRFSGAHAEIEQYSAQRMLQPEKIVLIADAKTAQLRPTEAMWKQDAAPRHAGHSNFLFADGHVELHDPKIESYVNDKEQGILNPSHWKPNFTK